MDGLSLAANIIAVLDASSKTAKAFKTIMDLRHAPQEVMQFANEISDFRAVAISAQETLRKLDGSENGTGPLNSLNARLDDIIERAFRNVVELNDIIHNRIIARSASSATRSVRISHTQWLKRHQHMKRLLDNIHKATMEISSSLTLLIASDIPRLQTAISGVEVNTRNFSTTLEHVRSDTVSQISSLQPRLETIQSSILELTTLVASSAGNISQSDRTNYEFRSSIFDRDANRCPKFCRCDCHVKLNLQTPFALRNLIGSLFIGYHGSPLMANIPCNERRCRRYQTCLLTVSYYFPGWFLHRMMVFKDSWTPMKDHMITVRTPRVVGEEGLAVFICALDGNVEGLQRLFGAGLASPFDVYAKNGETPLHGAVNRKRMSACEFLISQYADLDALDLNRSTPMDLVFNDIMTSPDTPIATSFKRIFARFLEDSVSLQGRDFSILHQIVLKISSVDLRSQLEYSTADIDVRCSEGKSALHWAIAKRDMESIQVLLEHGARIDSKDNYGKNTIHIASEKFPQVLPLLLDSARTHEATEPHFRQSLINARSIVGDTPLHLASRWDFTGISATLLLDRFADVDATRYLLMPGVITSPILLAIEENNHATIKVLLEHGANPNIKGCQNMGLLHLAAGLGDIETMEILIEAELWIQGYEDEDMYGRVPLQTFEVDRPKLVTEDAGMKERCRVALVRLLDQQRSRETVIEEMDGGEYPDDASSVNSDADVFFDFEEPIE